MRRLPVRSVLATVAAGLALLGCASTPTSDGVSRDFVAMTTTGDEISGESIRGHVTIIDFWAVF
jgi:type IV pilus biogenesis protein CpaD/CtpE